MDTGTDLASGLREAHRRVRALSGAADRRERLARRLVAICDAAKLDLGSAAARLSVFLDDLAALESGRDPETLPEQGSDTPSRRNMPLGD
ncbi:hypothetical protein [Spongiactinospora sp. 9N601]|uniref:hypothetical protein n=1 Tax=Spongiactinospora sp. 9N601 TaxID=3375149 RepID=UPI00379BEFCC